jgi:hypothetical protein
MKDRLAELIIVREDKKSGASAEDSERCAVLRVPRACTRAHACPPL